jgi:hypothetical protein
MDVQKGNLEMEGPCTRAGSIGDKMRGRTEWVNITKMIKCASWDINDYKIIPADPAKGILYITENNPGFISGHVRMRGKDEGRYPFHYLDMINSIFGEADYTIECCSRSVEGYKQGGNVFTVDINRDTNSDMVANCEDLHGLKDQQFERWRCDPPYNEETARVMYGTKLPATSSLLEAGARVCKEGALMFLLLGPTNYQWCPPGVIRIGIITMTIVPNNELRALNIFLKLKNVKYSDSKYQSQLPESVEL